MMAHQLQARDDRVRGLLLMAKDSGLVNPETFSNPQRPTTAHASDGQPSSTRSGIASTRRSFQWAQNGGSELSTVQEGRTRIMNAEAAADNYSKEQELARRRREAAVRAKRAADLRAKRDTEMRMKREAEDLKAKKDMEARARRDQDVRQRAEAVAAGRARVEQQRIRRKDTLQVQSQPQLQSKVLPQPKPLPQPPPQSTDRPASTPVRRRKVASSYEPEEDSSKFRGAKAPAVPQAEVRGDPKWCLPTDQEAQKGEDRASETKQRPTTVEQRVDDDLTDEPAGIMRKKLAEEARLIREETARVLTERNAAIKKRLESIESRIDNDIRKPPKTPTASTQRRSARSVGLSEAEEVFVLRSMLHEPETTRHLRNGELYRMGGIATSSLMRIDDGSNMDQGAAFRVSETARLDAALKTNRPVWDSTSRHHVPSALRGIRPVTQEPWSMQHEELTALGSAWDKDGELRPSQTAPMPRTPYFLKEPPPKTPSQLATPTGSSARKRKGPASPTAKARVLKERQEAEALYLQEVERAAREAEEAAHKRAEAAKEERRRLERAARAENLRMQAAEGTPLSDEDHAFLDSAVREEASELATELRRRVAAGEALSANDAARLDELTQAQLKELHGKMEAGQALDDNERTLLEELDAFGRTQAPTDGGTLATSHANLVELLLRALVPKCVPLW